MYKYDSKEELHDKIDNEGGVLEAILVYGIFSENLPDNTPPEIVEAWKKIESVYDAHELINDWIW